MKANAYNNANNNSQRGVQAKRRVMRFRKLKNGVPLCIQCFLLGVTTKIIGGFAVSDNHSQGELPFFQDVVLQTQSNCPNFDTLFGDGIYANRVARAVLGAG